jgi:hypothetical protein
VTSMTRMDVLSHSACRTLTLRARAGSAPKPLHPNTLMEACAQVWRSRWETSRGER